MLLVDTNVLVDVLQDDPQWADGSVAQLRAQARLHARVIKRSRSWHLERARSRSRHSCPIPA